MLIFSLAQDTNGFIGVGWIWSQVLVYWHEILPIELIVTHNSELVFVLYFVNKKKKKDYVHW